MLFYLYLGLFSLVSVSVRSAVRHLQHLCNVIYFLLYVGCQQNVNKMSKISIRAKICLNPSKYTRILALIFDFTFIIQIISTFFHVEKWLFFRMKFLNLVHFVWSLSQAAQRPVIRFDEGSNHGSDCRR